MAYLNHNIPPFSAYIRNEYLYNHTKGKGEFTFADIHTVNCMERRSILFECLLPNGVNWTRRPIHSFVWKKDAPRHALNIHMYWDCFSPYVDVQRRNRLANYLIDQNFYTVENTREDTITDDSYFTQWEQEAPDQFNLDEKQAPIGQIHKKNKS